MENIENLSETMSEIKKHLRKLASVVENEATFTFIDVKIHNKARIDDVLCCVEANFPAEYKTLVRLSSHKDYKSVAIYHSLKRYIQRKFFFSSSKYLIQYGEAVSCINSFSKVLEHDLKKLSESSAK